MALTEREEEILAAITQNPMITQQELASMLGITRSGAAAHIFNLMRKGYIQGKGYIVSPSQYIAVVGGVNIDIHGMASEEVVESSSNVGHVITSIGGIARNVSYNLTALGVQNYLVALYGDDANGKLFKEDAHKHGMDITRSLQIHESTSQYLSVVSASGEQIVALDDMSISAGITPQFLQQREGLFSHAAVTVLDTSLSQEAITWLCEHVHQPIYARAVSVNKAKRLVSVLDRIDTLVLAAPEAWLVSGIAVHSVEDAVLCARTLLERGVRRVVLMVNAVSAVYADEQGMILVSVPEYLQGKHLSNGAATALLSTLAWQYIERARATSLDRQSSDRVRSDRGQSDTKDAISDEGSVTLTHSSEYEMRLAMASASLVLDCVEATSSEMTAELVVQRSAEIVVQQL